MGQRGNTPAHTQVPLGGEARAAGWLVGWDGWREWAPHTPSSVAEHVALGVQSVGRGAQACCEERALPFHQAQRLEGRRLHQVECAAKRQAFWTFDTAKGGLETADRGK